MPSSAAEILETFVETLRASGKFRLVMLGDAPSNSDVPRASILYEGQESFQPDDHATTRWVRLRASISIRTRSTDTAEATTRVNELCEDAMATLLEDPFRGERCQDLPIGRATELGRSELVRGLKRPEVEMTFVVRCHFEDGEES